MRALNLLCCGGIYKERAMGTPGQGQQAEVVVGGAGFAGLALAIALRQGLGDPFRVTVADPTLAHARSKDPRASAIAAAARRLFEAIGVWDTVAGSAQPILDMVVTDSKLDNAVRPAFLTFSGEVEEGEPFAHMIENGPRYCLQYSPMKSGKDAETSSVRKGDMAYYYWLYPNFMLNWYEGVMDINLVIPLGVDRCEVIFDFYFDDVGTTAEARNRQSVCVGERVQQEDIDICESVQRGLTSRAYVAGRLSVRREAGEHLFHRLLAADLKNCTSD